MHELGIMTGVMEAVEKTARQAGADKVLKVSLSVGVMTEAVEDALSFAFEALSEGTISENAELVITMVQPKSMCEECGTSFTHDRFQVVCQNCGSPATRLIAGKELQIDSIEVDIPDNEDQEHATQDSPDKE